MQTKTNAKNQIWKRLFMPPAKPNPYQTMCIEAKEKGFNFSVYKGELEYIVPAENVEIFFDKIELITEAEQKYSIEYSQLAELQTRLKTKTINLILKKQNWQYLLLLASPVVLAYFMMMNSYFLARLIEPDPELAVIYTALALMFASYIFWLASSRKSYREQQDVRLRAVSAGRAQTIIKRLEEAVDDEKKYFSRLITTNVENIERYYSLIEEQSNKSYQLTRSGALAGFILLVFGIVLSFVRPDAPTTTLTVASGLLIEFISAVFFYLYNRTIQELDTYHKRLIEVQNTMLALRIAHEIENDETIKNQTLHYLTRSLMNHNHVDEENILSTTTDDAAK